MAGDLSFPTFESFKNWFAEKTLNHPFKLRRYQGRFYEDFVAGRVQREFLKQYARQFYIFIQMTNANVTWTLINYVDLWRKHPELYNIVAAKMGSELCDPSPGGHGRTYLKYARYLGLRDEELLNSKPIPELEARFNTALLYRSQSPAQTAVRWMLEGFVGYNMGFWRETLHEKYGVPNEALEYFDIHVEADLGEHGPEGEMLLQKLYGLGMVKEEDHPGMRLQVERAVEGNHPGSQTFSWQNALYDRYLARVGLQSRSER
jgi:pyrroloquinoline quinone (PQQ) biosynthesis protein C